MTNTIWSAPIVPSQLPNAFDAGQFGKYISDTSIPKNKLTVAPRIKPSIPSANIIPQAEKIKFKLLGVKFEGNTVYSSKELMTIFAASLNKTITLADLQNLIQKITVKYRAAGYILSRAILPPQHITNGVVRIQVIEGYINQITYQGKAGSSLSLIKKYTQTITASRPLSLPVLERAMLLANGLPGLTVKSVITPSPKTPAAAKLDIISERQLLDGYAMYDNYGSRFLGPHEIAVGGNINSWILPGDQNSLHLANTTQHQEMLFEEFVHSQVITSKGTTWSLGTNYTRTQPGFTLESAEIVGQSFSLYSNIDHPFVRSRSENLILHGMANYQNVNSTILGFPFYQDRFRTLGVGLYYDVADRWDGINNIEVDLFHGFPFFGAQDHALQSRPFGQTVFTKVTLVGSRLQPLFKRTSAYLGINSQYAFNPLLATQQISYGGAQFGRGYEPAEITGDKGLGGKFEIRVDTNPELKFLQSIQYYAFYDECAIWNINTIAQADKLSLASTGLGARVTLIPQLTGEVYLAKPLTKEVATLDSLQQNSLAARVFFQLTARL